MTNDLSEKRWRIRLCALAVASILAVGVTEVALRMLGFRFDCAKGVILTLRDTTDHRYGSDAIVDDPYVFKRFRPGSTFGSFKFNSHGLRGPDFSPQKPSGATRVVGLGDSNVFALGVEVADAFPARVAKMLEAETGVTRTEAILAGVPSYTSFQSRQMFERSVQHWEPDLLLVYMGAFNDYQRSKYYTDVELLAANMRANKGFRALRIWQVANKNALRLRRCIRGRPPCVSVDEFCDNIRAIARICDRRGITCVLIVPCLPAKTLEIYPTAGDYQEAVVRVGKELGLPVCDPSKELLSKAGVFFGDKVHINTQGHHRIADLVIPVLRNTPFYRSLKK